MSRIQIVAFIMMSGCLAATGACRKDPETAKRDYMRSGDQYVAQKKYREAVIEYRNAVQVDPAVGEARLRLAETYEHLGDTSSAFAEYVRAADLLPGNADVQVKTANYLLLARQFENAKSRADKALAAAPDNVEAQIAKGNALAGLKEFDAAVAEIEGAIRENPDRGASYGNLGALEVARGNRDQAEAAFRKAIAADPKSVRGRLALANLYWSNGNVPAAERELKAAVAMQPESIAANRALAVFFFVTNRGSDAEPYLKTVADVSRQVGDRFVLADYYSSTARSVEATAILQDLAKTDTQAFAAATIRLSAIAARGGDAAGARRLIDDVIRKAPRNAAALVASANLFLEDKKYDQALSPAEDAVRLDPRSASAQFALAKVRGARLEWDRAIAAYDQVLKLDPRINAARVELARISFVTGRPEDAIRFAQEALTAQPGLTEATMILARATLAKGDVAADPHVKQLASGLPKSAAARIELGQLYALKGDSKSARSAFEQALAIDPTNIGALAGLTALDIQSKNPAAARARVDARLAADPNDPRLLLLAARLSTALGDVNGTERSLRRAIEIDPGQLEAYSLLGQLYASQRRLDEARAEFETIARQRPKIPAAPTVVGMILQMQNRLPEAQASYEKVMAMDPRAAVAANNLAWMYAEGGGNLDVALGLAQTAKSQLPDSPAVSDTLGWVYYKKGIPSLAVSVLRESVSKSPKNAVYQYHLGLAYAKSGNRDEARKILEQALVLDPKFDGSADARRVLEGLKG